MSSGDARHGGFVARLTKQRGQGASRRREKAKASNGRVRGVLEEAGHGGAVHGGHGGAAVTESDGADNSGR
jgi:hypothetical protein